MIVLVVCFEHHLVVKSVNLSNPSQVVAMHTFPGDLEIVYMSKQNKK